MGSIIETALIVALIGGLIGVGGKVLADKQGDFQKGVLFGRIAVFSIVLLLLLGIVGLLLN